MKNINLKKWIIPNLPYLLFVYLFDKAGQALRLTPGVDASEKLLRLSEGFTAALASYAPSFHPADLLIGIAGTVVIRLIVYMKGKNAKKYRSPILANIYMNELDSYMAEYAEKFNCGNRRKINPAFKKKLDVCRGKEERLKRNLSKMSEEEKEGLIAEIRELRRSLKSMPYSDQMDDSYKRICYIRYADDFLIGVIGSKEDAEQIKQDVGCFIRDKLHLEMSEEKTLITHGHDAAKFLGYEVTIAKGEHNKKTKTGATRRVNNGKVLLYVPHDKWVKRLFSYNALKIKYDKQNGNKEVWEPVRRTRLLHLDDLEILNQYNAEIRGLYNYYRLANNVSVLNNFYYVMRWQKKE